MRLFLQISPIISIVFNMLIICVGLAKDPSFGSSGASHGAGGVSASGWAAALAERSHGVPARRRPDGSFELRDLKVEITLVVEDDASVSVGAPLALTRADLPLKVAPLDLEGGEGEDESSKSSFGPWRVAFRDSERP